MLDTTTATTMLPATTAELPSATWPRVSVIIPVKNDARRLAVCLASLAEQDYPEERFEVIVVDNGSSDDSREVAEKAGLKVLSFPGLHVGALRNRGVAAASGEVLAFVDSDHEVPPVWIQAGVELSSQSSAVIVGSPCLAPPHGTWVQRCWELHRLRNRQRREVAWLGAGNMFLRRSDFDRVGGFDEELVAAEDVDLCVRLAEQGGKIVSDMLVANVHHGEPPTLRQFFKKEFWRGSSGVRAFIVHGMPLHEAPSLVWPLFHLLGVISLVAAIVYGIGRASPAVPLAATAALVLPSLLLSIKTCWQVRKQAAIPALATLYLTYGLCRAAALFKR